MMRKQIPIYVDLHTYDCEPTGRQTDRQAGGEIFELQVMSMIPIQAIVEPANYTNSDTNVKILHATMYIIWVYK